MNEKRAPVSFAGRLDALLKEEHLTVRRAAEIAAVPASTIQSWRTGTAPTNFLAVTRLATALRTTLAFLLTGEGEPPAPGPLSIEAAIVAKETVFEGYCYISMHRLIPRDEVPSFSESQSPENESRDDTEASGGGRANASR